MGAGIRVTSGPAIEKAGDLAALLTNLAPGDILFIDEIHRLNRAVEEILYPAMEDFAIDIIVGKGPSANSIRLDLPHFTLIGATTRAGQLSSPLRDRFGVQRVWNCIHRGIAAHRHAIGRAGLELRSSLRARGRLRPVRAERRVSQTACCAVYAILHRSATTV